RRLVVLVLEPRELLHPPQNRSELTRVLLPRRGPVLLVGVLRPDLEEEAHAVPRDRDLEVAVLLVAALVRREGDPRVVGRIHGAPRVLRDVRERVAAGRARERGREALAECLQLRTDPALDRAHARLEALHVED